MSTENTSALHWKRVHPASPFVRGWIALAALVLGYWQSTDELSWSERFSGTRLYWTLVIGAAVLVLVLIGYFLSWLFTRYALSATHVYINSGMLIRSAKQARIDMVQGIDIAQPLVARLLGLAELRFDVADGGESMLRLSFLRKAHAERLREEILALARGQRQPSPEAEHRVQPTVAAPTAEPSEERVLVQRVPAGRTLASIFIQLPAIIGVLALLVFGVLWLVGVDVAITGLLPALFGFGSWIYQSLNKSWNFTATRTGDRIHLSYGFTDTRSHTIPLHRVQAVGISSPLLWRMIGWYRMEVNVLGTKEDEAGTSSLRVLPVGDFESVAALMGVLRPDLGVENPRQVLLTAVSSGEEHGFISSPPRARLLSPGAWKHQSFLVTATTVVTRSGWLCRSASFIPHNRIQGMAWHQGPWERRRALAGVSLEAAGGNIMGVLHQIDQDAAAEFFHAQKARMIER